MCGSTARIPARNARLPSQQPPQRKTTVPSLNIGDIVFADLKLLHQHLLEKSWEELGGVAWWSREKRRRAL